MLKKILTLAILSFLSINSFGIESIEKIVTEVVQDVIEDTNKEINYVSKRAIDLELNPAEKLIIFGKLQKEIYERLQEEDLGALTINDKLTLTSIIAEIIEMKQKEAHDDILFSITFTKEGANWLKSCVHESINYLYSSANYAYKQTLINAPVIYNHAKEVVQQSYKKGSEQFMITAPIIYKRTKEISKQILEYLNKDSNEAYKKSITDPEQFYN